MIVVAPNGLYSAMFCNDASGRRPVEQVIMEELIPHVDASYRTVATREGRALEGFSRVTHALRGLYDAYPGDPFSFDRRWAGLTEG